MEINFNVNKVSYLVCHPEAKNVWFKYFEERRVKRCLGLLSDEVKPAGFYEWTFYNGLSEYPISLDSICKDKLMVRDNVVYYRPYVEIHMDNGDKILNKFESWEELDAWVKEIIAINGDIFIDIKA